MLPQHHHPIQVPECGAEACPRCGVIDRPTLTAGTGPHAIRASCGHCGGFIKWISVLAPSERQARRMQARLKAMQQHPPSEAQLSFLQALGDQATAPQNIADASERIEALKSKQGQE